MGLLPISGSETTTLSPTNSANVEDVNSDVPSVEDTLKKKDYVKDTYNNSNALTIDRDQDIIDAIKGYGEGTPIIVTWFHNMESKAVKQSTISTVSFLSDSVNQSFLRINHFEMRIKAGFDFSYDNEQTRSELTGTGLIFPGFIPKQGDLFLYELEPGKLGLFKITNAPTRLSIKTDTSHEVTYKLHDIVGSSELNLIFERVREEAYFSKQRFLQEAGALLTKSDVVCLKYIEEKHKELAHYYVTEFFDTLEYQSFKRPDDIYDPYIIEFIRATAGYDTLGVHVLQLLTDLQLERKSFFAKLLDPKKISWKIYIPNSDIYVHEIDAVSTRVNALINRPYIASTDQGVYVEPPDPGSATQEELDAYALLVEAGMDEVNGVVEPYISGNIGSTDQSSFTDFDTLIAFYMDLQVVDVDSLVLLVDNFYDMTPMEKFYRVPILMFFLKVVEHAIQTGEPIRITAPGALPYVELPFQDGDERLVGNILTIISPDAQVIALLDDNGNTLYLETLDIIYNPEGFIIDLTVIMAEEGVTVIPDSWKVVISNKNLILV
jgi:hypothetical protein